MPRGLALVIGLACLLLAGRARAQAPRRLLLLDSPETLYEASMRSLTPWGIDIVQREAPSPNANPKGLCDEFEVDAVAWITDAGEHITLTIFIAENNSLSTRDFAIPQPIAASDAAALALTIKTTLLAAREDTGAAPEAAQESSQRPKPRALAADSLWTVDAILAARRGLGVATDGRLELGMTHERGGLVLGLGASMGTSYDVVTPEFDGRLHDAALIARAGLRQTRGRMWGHGFVAASLHRIALRGALRAEGRDASRTRYNPAVGLGSQLGLSAGGLRVGLELLAQRYTRRQRFTVRDEEVVHLPLWELRLGLLLSHPL